MPKQTVGDGVVVMRRCGVFLIAVVVGFGVMLAGPASRQPTASALAATTITGWSTSPVSATVGFTLNVAVRVSTGSGFEARTVAVQRRRAGVPTWTTVSSLQTAATGHATVGLMAPAVGGWEFRLYVPATATAATASTAVRAVTGMAGVVTTVTGWSTAAVTVQPGSVLAVPVRVQTGSGYVARKVQLQRRFITATAWGNVVTAMTAADGWYTVKLSAPPGTWQFRLLVPVSQTGREAQTAVREVTVKDTVPPGPVTDLTAGSGRTRTSIPLSWTNPTDADLAAVLVRRAVGATPPASVTAGTAVPTAVPRATSVTDKGLTPSRQYSYAVFTRDTHGNVRTPGAVITTETGPGMALGRISAGYFHACGFDSLGQGWCWGSDQFGQLGDGAGNPLRQYRPVAVAGGLRFTSISAGHDHTCGVIAGGGSNPAHVAGSAWCWGSDAEGQLGDGPDGEADESAPVPVAGGHVFTGISAGGWHTCGHVGDGSIWCWGYDGNGQVGDGPASQGVKYAPVQVTGGHDFYGALTAGSYGHTCALSAGQAWCWGRDFYGQLGNGDDDEFIEPAPVAVALVGGGVGGNYNRISAGFNHTCGVDYGRKAVCWGQDEYGQVGDGSSDQTPKLVPTAVAGGLTFDSVSAGYMHSCGVDANNKGWCWGRDQDGQIGDGNDGQADEYAPVAVAGGLQFHSIAAGIYNTCGIDARGFAWCWGYDNYGTLGDGNDGTNANQYLPVPVAPAN